MKLLFDENLSQGLVELLATEFPESVHVETLGMRGTTDAALWEYAKNHEFAIVSKDNDFRQRAFVHGSPPKVIWLSMGNAGTSYIGELLRTRVDRIRSFVDHPDESMLVLQAKRRSTILAYPVHCQNDESTPNFRYDLPLFSRRLHPMETPNSSPGLAAQASAPACKKFHGRESIHSAA